MKGLEFRIGLIHFVDEQNATFGRGEGFAQGFNEAQGFQRVGAAVDFDRQKTSLGIQKSKILPYEQSFAASMSEARFGRELWKIFLWAAAVLLAVEMLFARDSAKQTEEQ